MTATHDEGFDHARPMEPSAEQFAALAGSDETGPVVMLNLVRFNEVSSDGDGTGSDAYLRYSHGFMPLLKRAGGTILWAGKVTGTAIGADDDTWDYAVLVQYPSRQSFVDTLSSADYAAINDTRLAGLAKHLILPVTETYSKLA